MMYYILAGIGALLIILNIITIIKERDSFKRHLRAEKKSITEMDIIIGELRSEFSQDILELQKEIVELNEKLDYVKKEQIFHDYGSAPASAYVHDNDKKIFPGKQGYDAVATAAAVAAAAPDAAEVPSDFEAIVDKALKTAEDTIIEASASIPGSEKGEFIINESLKSENLQEPGSSKIMEIGNLLQHGISDEEICGKFNIGKGELLLIKGLYLKKAD